MSRETGTSRSWTWMVAPVVLSMVAVVQAWGEGRRVPPIRADVRDPKVAEHYEALRAAPRLPDLPVRPARLRDETRAVGVERIEGLIDGAVLVSRPVDSAQQDRLVAMGVRVATSPDERGHHTLWQGRYHRLLTLVPDGPDALTLERLTGTDVRLETALRSDRRAVLLAVRGGAS